MKKAVLLGMTGLLSLSIVGCSKPKEAIDTDVSPRPTETITVTPTATLIPTLTPTLAPTLVPQRIDKIVAITDDVYQEYFYTEDDIIYSSIATTFPVLNGSTEAIAKINEDLRIMKENYIESSKEWNDVILEDETLVTEEFFYPSDFQLDYTVAYNQKGILNLLFNGYDYTGGAHGMPSQTSLVYDLNTGDKLTLTDFVSVDETRFHDRVYQEFEKQYNESPDNFFEDDSLTMMDEGISFDMSFYLGKEGITFYFHPYEVSYYAAGFIEATIPWSDPIFKDFN